MDLKEKKNNHRRSSNKFHSSLEQTVQGVVELQSVAVFKDHGDVTLSDMINEHGRVG